MAYLSHVGTYLTYLGEELYAGHPFIEAKACFPGEVVEMGY
jgi:hypothetical protein